MSMIRGVLKQLRAVLRKRAVERELDDELRFHVDMETEKNRRAGMGEAEARRAALLAFGGIEKHKEDVRTARWTHFLDDLARDLLLGCRALGRDPFFGMVTFLTLTLGVGVTTTVFSVANAILLRPLPVAEPERLFELHENRAGAVSSNMGHYAVPYSRYRAYQEGAVSVFSGLAAERWSDISLRAGDDARSVPGGMVSSNYFSVLGKRPALGRFFASESEQALVLSYALWQRQFGGDRAVIGSTVHVNSQAFTVIGGGAGGFQWHTSRNPDGCLGAGAGVLAGHPGRQGRSVDGSIRALGTRYGYRESQVDGGRARFP